MLSKVARSFLNMNLVAGTLLILGACNFAEAADDIPIPIQVLRSSYQATPLLNCLGGQYVDAANNPLGYLERCHSLRMDGENIEIGVPTDYGYGEVPELIHQFTGRSYISGDSDPKGVCRFYGFDKYISREVEHWAPENGRQLIRINRKGKIVAKGDSPDFKYLQTITCGISD